MCASSYWGCCYCPNGAYKIKSKRSQYYCILKKYTIYIGVIYPFHSSLHDSAGNTGLVSCCGVYYVCFLSLCLCSAPCGHQWEPQWLCHANAAISSGCGFSCICHLQIQEVKCSWNVMSIKSSHCASREVVKDVWACRGGSWQLSKQKRPARLQRRLIAACQTSTVAYSAVLQQRIGFFLTHLQRSCGNSFVRSIFAK